MFAAEIASPLVLILIGPPGAGKGTHAAPLSQHLGLPHISTGDLFREHIRGKTPLGLEARSFIDAGQLVPDSLVLDMLFDRIQKEDCGQGYILDGFPRTVAQAEAFEKRMSGQLLALNFNISDGILVERITGRLACKGCGRPFHCKLDPPLVSGICDQCGGSLYQREDDTVEIIVKRLEVYHTQTEPVIQHYRRQPGVLHEIDAAQAKELVFQEVLRVSQNAECRMQK